MSGVLFFNVTTTKQQKEFKTDAMSGVLIFGVTTTPSL